MISNENILREHIRKTILYSYTYMLSLGGAGVSHHDQK